MPRRGALLRCSVTGRVDGRCIDFMVDTGASVIALKPEDAAGIHPLGVRLRRAGQSAIHYSPSQLFPQLIV
jgi:hypothetical protein